MMRMILLGLAGLVLGTGCSAGPATVAGNKGEPVPVQGGQVFSKQGVHVWLGGLPTGPVAHQGAFEFTVFFENAPRGAGVDVSIVPAEPDRSLSGGALTLAPKPIDATGTTTFRFAGEAASAPDDMPQFYPVRPGRYVLVATLYSTRESWLGMIRPKGEMLAQYRSAPVVLR